MQPINLFFSCNIKKMSGPRFVREIYLLTHPKKSCSLRPTTFFATVILAVLQTASLTHKCSKFIYCTLTPRSPKIANHPIMTHKTHDIQKIPKIMGVCPHTFIGTKGFRHGGGNMVTIPLGKIETLYYSQIPPQKAFNVCYQGCGAFDTLP